MRKINVFKCLWYGWRNKIVFAQTFCVKKFTHVYRVHKNRDGGFIVLYSVTKYYCDRFFQWTKHYRFDLKSFDEVRRFLNSSFSLLYSRAILFNFERFEDEVFYEVEE